MNEETSTNEDNSVGSKVHQCTLSLAGLILPALQPKQCGLIGKKMRRATKKISFKAREALGSSSSPLWLLAALLLAVVLLHPFSCFTFLHVKCTQQNRCLKT
jgi:hypothetical protein